jgi:hypothetical protein
MTTGAQLTFLEPGLAAGALENMPLRLQFRFCGSATFRRLAGADAGRLPLPQQLTQDEKAAAFKKMANQIADIKETHKRQAMRP